MDNIDYKILRCLKDNARLTASAISEEINLSVSAVIERIRKMESIVACFYMTGDFDFILKIVTDSAAGLDEVYRFVKGYEGVSATETHFVLKTLKDEVSVIPEVKEK